MSHPPPLMMPGVMLCVLRITHVLPHTLYYGMGVFEGIRAYKTARGPAVFRLNEHIRRLFNSARPYQ